tara:strand:- start:280 stop:594 length:315 start_codon:yes stop_codon:yes gene_type:complete
MPIYKPVKLTIITFLIILFGASNADKNDQLANNEIILNHFNVQEAEELQKIHDFFIAHISTAEDKNSPDAIADLDDFLRNLKDVASTGAISIPINYQAEKELIK